MGIPATEVLVVGDSLEKDVLGSAAAGLRCVWVNRLNASRSGGIAPTFEINALTDLPRLVSHM